MANSTYLNQKRHFPNVLGFLNIWKMPHHRMRQTQNHGQGRKEEEKKKKKQGKKKRKVPFL